MCRIKYCEYYGPEGVSQTLQCHNNDIKEQQDFSQMKDTVSGGQMLQHHNNKNNEEQQELSQMKDTTISYMNNKEL